MTRELYRLADSCVRSGTMLPPGVSRASYETVCAVRDLPADSLADKPVLSVVVAASIRRDLRVVTYDDLLADRVRAFRTLWGTVRIWHRRRNLVDEIRPQEWCGPCDVSELPMG